MQDDEWVKVAIALEKGFLGPRCKTSPTGFVIIVYTYDFRDQEDVLRVGMQLQHMFPKRMLSYKPDVFTNSLQGIYGSQEIPRSLFTLHPQSDKLAITKGKDGASALEIALSELAVELSFESQNPQHDEDK